MTESSTDLDVSQLRSDIHGERVAAEAACNYCGASLDSGQPVMYDIIRVADLPNLEQLFDLPAGWFPDAVRCQTYERDTLAPATDGFDEALVMIHLAESNNLLSIDASSTTVVDFSPDSEGYHRIPVSSCSKLPRAMRLTPEFVEVGDQKASETVEGPEINQYTPIGSFCGVSSGGQ